MLKPMKTCWRIIIRELKEFILGTLSCIIAGLVVASDLFYILNYNLSIDLVHFLRISMLSLFVIFLGIIVIVLLKIKIAGNNKRTYYTIAVLVVIFDLFYVFNRTPSTALMHSLKLVILNFFGIALGVIGLLKIKITGNGNRTYYIVGCISNLMLIIRHYINGFILFLIS